MIDMEATAFDQLEQRIGQAIDRIRNLERARDEALELATEQEQEVVRLRARNEELERQLAEVRESSVPRTEYEERKREIERRVESLLQRFGELEESASE